MTGARPARSVGRRRLLELINQWQDRRDQLAADTATAVRSDAADEVVWALRGKVAELERCIDDLVAAVARTS